MDFNLVSKVIWQWLWFCIVMRCGWIKSLVPFYQPIVSCSHTFSHVLHQLHVFGVSFDWFTGLSTLLAIDQSGFGFKNTQ